MSTPFSELDDERFVSLTTFRTSGDPVSTPVWIAADGEALVVTTPAGSGKVKRLRNNQKVEMRPCDRRGRVDPTDSTVAGVAEILTDSATVEHLTAPIRTKYGFEFKLVMGIERVAKRGRQAERVMLRITPA